MVVFLSNFLLTHGQVLNSSEGYLPADPPHHFMDQSAPSTIKVSAIQHPALVTNNVIEKAEKNSIRKAATIGGLAGGVLGMVLAVTVWDGENYCNPIDPLCGALSEKVFKINIPSMILNGAIGGGIGAGVGALIGIGSKAGKRKKQQSVSVDLGIIPTRKDIRPKPSLRLRFSL